jgi:hypothetical protein
MQSGKAGNTLHSSSFPALLIYLPKYDWDITLDTRGSCLCGLEFLSFELLLAMVDLPSSYSFY